MNKNFLKNKYPTHVSFLCDSVVVTANKFKNCSGATFFISENQSKYDTTSLMALRETESQLTKNLIKKVTIDSTDKNNKNKIFKVKPFTKSINIDQHGFTATDGDDGITFDKILDLPKEINLESFLNIKDHICELKDSDKKISVEEICKLTKLDKIRIIISADLYSFHTNEFVFIRGTLKNITVHQQTTKNIYNKVTPKQTDTGKIFVPKYSAKTSTITEKVLDILKNDQK